MTEDQNTPEATLIEGDIKTDAKAVPCTCGGYADEVDPTDDEDSKYGCGRYKCCCAAFVCRICGKRLVARREAYDADW